MIVDSLNVHVKSTAAFQLLILPPGKLVFFFCCSVPERVFQGTKSASTRRLYLTDGMIPKYTGYVPRKSSLFCFLANLIWFSVGSATFLLTKN